MNLVLSRRRQGFTLLEIMMAMLICAVVFSVIYSSYSGTIRNKEVVESEADIYMAARIALERIVEDLESAYMPVGIKDEKPEGDQHWPTAFTGEVMEIDGRRSDLLRFLSRAHVSFSDDERPLGIAQITYRVVRRGDGRGLDLYRSDRSPFEEGSQEEDGGILLCERLNSVRFFYYDTNGNAYEVWDSTGEEHEGSLPARVTVVLEFLNRLEPETPIRFLTSASLPLGLQESDGHVS